MTQWLNAGCRILYSKEHTVLHPPLQPNLPNNYLYYFNELLIFYNDVAAFVCEQTFWYKVPEVSLLNTNDTNMFLRRYPNYFNAVVTHLTLAHTTPSLISRCFTRIPTTQIHKYPGLHESLPSGLEGTAYWGASCWYWSHRRTFQSSKRHQWQL